jgi:hypothetical protein
MSSSLNAASVLQGTSPGRAYKRAIDVLRADANTRTSADKRTENDDTSVTGLSLTLDDFGGRSDALGG